MEKLMEIEGNYAVDSTGSTNDVEIDIDKYQKFMSINPIWDYFNIPKNEYLMQTREQRVPLIQKYYKSMVNGKRLCLSFFFFFIIIILI